jgi:hypothetical protein
VLRADLADVDLVEPGVGVGPDAGQVLFGVRALSAPQQTFRPPWTGRSPPPDSRYNRTKSASGCTDMYPSPIRAASLMAFSPNPDT